jgi:hypothetical protein
MTSTPPPYLLQGPFNFLRPEADEIRALAPDVERWLPRPGVSFLEDEGATPIRGFPYLLSPELAALRAALERFVLAEEELQAAVFLRRSAPRQPYQAAWDRYRALLLKAVENVTISSYGRGFPAIFWLQHSLVVARLLKESPRRILRLDLGTGRAHGDTIKYRVLERYLDRVLTETYDLVSRLADDTEEVEEELFPRLLSRMRDNVLIFSEDHVGPDLAELASYFNGYLRLDGRDLLRRLQLFADWQARLLASDAPLRDTVRHLLAPSPAANPAAAPDPATRARELLNRPGWVSYLSIRPDYPAERLLPAHLVRVWESLLVKLKEFELFHGLRRYLLPVEREGQALVCRSGAAARILGGRQELRLSPATRPLDFMAPWVVDPQVSRFGLIYDLTDFSEIISLLRRSGTEVQDESFRRMFRFQRRLNRLAAANRLKLEKYLGDGAFYSSRHALNVLVGGVLVQRAYRQAIAEGFPFDRGMRVALNHGQYRLIPIDTGPGGPERYEFFGHGLVELSRLITGKATRELEEVKTMLVAQGYPEATVYRFFSPLLQRKVETIEPRHESRPFYAAINANGNLVNEGIVATEPFVAHLDQELRRGGGFRRARDGELGYVVVCTEEAGGLLVGLRKMGLAHLKGLDRIPVYEVVDGAAWEGLPLAPAPGATLMEAIERDAAEESGAGAPA